MLMMSDLVDLLVLVNRLWSLVVSYHHAPQLTTTSCLTLLIGPIVTYRSSLWRLSPLKKKKKKKTKGNPSQPSLPFCL